jgi:hypothetical protein
MTKNILSSKSLSAIKPKRFWKTRRFLLAVLLLFLAADLFVAWRIPNFKERVEWRLSLLQYDVRSRLFPQPPDMPTVAPEEATRMQAAQANLSPAPTTTLLIPTESVATAAPSPGPTQTNPGPETAVTPPPSRVSLAFHYYEFEKYNNCGPANLSMMLRYWGWQGTQDEVAAFTKPNPKDKNIMPYEMQDFVTEKTSLEVLFRSGGSLDDLRRLIAAGFPVVIEKSVVLLEHNLGWMGHSLLLTGYDDVKREFTGQDSLSGPDLSFSYDYIVSSWRPFNFHYIIAFPKDRESDVLRLLGPNADENYNLQSATDLALQETKTMQDSQDLAFAWYNVGTNYTDQRRYVDAANAYDMARSLGVPWRIIWYETGPYKAYYWSHRYQTIVDLASYTLNGETELEESWYWRGMARMALGDSEGAISDWRQALAKHVGFPPALDALQQAGAVP